MLHDILLYDTIMLCAVELNVVIYMRKQMREILMDTLDICNKMWGEVTALEKLSFSVIDINPFTILSGNPS